MDDDFCCRCGKRMLASAASWVIGGDPLHIFCSHDCAEHGPNCDDHPSETGGTGCQYCGAPLNPDESCSKSCVGVGDG